MLPEYQNGWKVTDIFPINSVGIVTSRDEFVINNDLSILKKKIVDFRDSELTDTNIKEMFHLSDNEGWNIAKARAAIIKDEQWETAFTQCLYRPFDAEFIFYHKAIIERSRSGVMRHMFAGKNLSLCIGRAGNVVGLDAWDILFCSRLIQDFNLFYRGGNVNFHFTYIQ